MKNYGKRTIPRDIHEFNDLIYPYYHKKEYSKVIGLLLSFWKRKGKSSTSSHYISSGLFASSFNGDLAIETFHIIDRYAIPTDDIVYENKLDFHPILDKTFKVKFSSSFDFLKRFYKTLEWDSPIDLKEEYYSKDYYKRLAPKELNYNKSWIYGIENNRLDIQVRAFIEFELKKVIQESTEKFRVNLGLSPSTSKWKSEQLLLDRIKKRFNDLIIIEQGSPKWLNGQRFDVWIPEHSLAIEYNGIQHYEAVEHFGGEDGLIEVQIRDEEKRRKCIENQVKLLEVREDYKFENVAIWINDNINKKK